MPKIDLHIHSEYSVDGEHSIDSIMDMCEEKEMKLVAIADHNCVRGIDEAIELGKQKGIHVISGIELDCIHKDTNIHLLGYGLDYKRKEFLQIEEDIMKQEPRAAEEKMDRFQKATGIYVDKNAVYDLADGAIITSETIAEIVLNSEGARDNELLKPYFKGGAKSDMPLVRFHWDFFAKGCPAFIPINFISFEEANDLISSAGGLSVLAHPGQNLKGNRKLIEELIELDMDGIEIFSPYHSMEDMMFYHAKAMEYDLLMTCGSDFHGTIKPHIHIGHCSDEVVFDEQKMLKQILNRIYR